MGYVARTAETRFRELLRTFPALMLVGPRQCGKSTSVRHLLPDWTHVDLERPNDLALLRVDPEGFFAEHPRHVAIDEAQRWPDLFALLRHVIDRGRGRGRYVLLGSASPELIRGASESLAGRLGMLELAPFGSGELPVRKRGDRWFWGGYPPIHALRRGSDRLAWLDGYVTMFLERDLPALGIRMSSVRLRSLWTMLTHVHGNLLNVSDLARSLAVSSHTIDAHLDVLESAFMIRRLPPYAANIQKRLTKALKLYVRDTGLLHFLAGLRSPAELRTWDRRGASFEGLVVEEIAALVSSHARPELFFWRTATGVEVDLLVKLGRTIWPIEIKLGATIDARDLAGLRGCMADLGLRRGFVIYGGAERRSIGGGIELVPWSDIVAKGVPFG